MAVCFWGSNGGALTLTNPAARSPMNPFYLTCMRHYISTLHSLHLTDNRTELLCPSLSLSSAPLLLPSHVDHQSRTNAQTDSLRIIG
jgi:hypothetical protein